MSGNVSKDQSDSNKVLSEEVTTHIIQIQPTKRQYLDTESLEGIDIESKRFDLSSI